MLIGQLPSRAVNVATMQTDRHSTSKTLIRKTWILSLLFSLIPAVCLGQTPDPGEAIRVDSNLVDLQVSVIGLNRTHPLPALEQRNFLVIEDGQPQEISFFAAADFPFDLVLLLDLSGSTRDKLKLIRSSAKRFVDATRPTDRVSVVTFTDMLLVACPLTLDRKLLKDSIDDIEKPRGGTNFWDSLRYVLATLLAPGKAVRRSAVVVMTDGVDNALPDVVGDGSRTTFEELLSIVRSSETLVFPIYLDTENEESQRHRTPRSAFVLARAQLAQLAEACGSRTHRADKIKDLDDVYEQVIADLGRVYSIGYRPSNTSRDGRWRSVTVRILDRSDLRARSKPGYYASSQPN